VPRTRQTLSLTALLAGCSITPENYAERFAEQECGIEHRCYPEDFLWSDLDACVADLLPGYQAGLDWAEDNCAPKYDLATDCWRAIERMSCDEIASPTEEPEACDSWMGCF
jgi:hypothetical protein